MAKMIRHYSPRGPKLRLNFSVNGKDVACSYERRCLIRDAIEETLFYERFLRDTEISVTLCDNESIRALNARYRQKDAATDVLSFPLYEREELEEETDGTVELGDIVLSVERAAAQAKELGHSTDREIAFLCVHSTLHLLGYDHERSAEEDEEMCRRQREIMEKIEG